MNCLKEKQQTVASVFVLTNRTSLWQILCSCNGVENIFIFIKTQFSYININTLHIIQIKLQLWGTYVCGHTVVDVYEFAIINGRFESNPWFVQNCGFVVIVHLKTEKRFLNIFNINVINILRDANLLKKHIYASDIVFAVLLRVGR